jgi:hypothetical protein
MINLLFIPYHNTGGHFIDWSLYFVTAQEHYISKNNQVIPVIQTVNEKTNNWHQHQSIMIQGFANLKNMLSLFNDQHVNFYVGMLPIETALETLFNTDIQSATVEQRSAAYTYILKDFEAMLRWTQNQKLMPVIFDYCESDLLSIFYNDRFPMWNQQKVKDLFVKQELHDQAFFKQSIEKFDQEIWDKRERLSLNMSKPNNCKIHQMINHSEGHLYYTTDDVWNNMPAIITEICTVLQLPLDSEKFKIWQKIYAQWRTVHDPYFGRHFDRIINSIVNGHYMRLDRFNLNFFQEALIQNALITKHNVNLKTWLLEKFPNNTQELHKLLEPNIHIL